MGGHSPRTCHSGEGARKTLYPCDVAPSLRRPSLRAHDRHRRPPPGKPEVRAAARNSRRAAIVASPGIYEEAARDPEKFWAEQARELEWIKPWTKVLEWKPPHAKWFVGGKLNIAVNCVDRHVTRSATKQSGADLGRRARRSANAHVLGPLPRSVASSRTYSRSSASRKAIASRSICR